MSDNESESSCISALEDISLAGTTPEPDKNTLVETRSNLSDDDQSEQPTIAESTTISYQECMPSDDDSRNSTPVCWTSLVDPKFIPKEVWPEKDQDDVESLKSQDLTDEAIVKERFVEQRSASMSPTKKLKIDEPIDEEPLEEYTGDVKSPAEPKEEDDLVVTKHQDVVESHKSEEELTEHGSASKSPTKKIKIDETIDEEPSEEYTGDVKSPTEPQEEDDLVVTKHQDVVESHKSEEELTEQGSASKSPTKKLKIDEPIDEEPSEEYTGDVKSPTKVQQADDPIVAEQKDVVESPKSEERLAEQASADESPTKKQQKDEADKETLEEHTDDVESPKSDEIQEEPTDHETGEERRDNVVLPESEKEIKCKSMIKEEDESIDTVVVADPESKTIESPEKEKSDVLTDKTQPEVLDKTASRPGLNKEYFEYILKGFYKSVNIRIDECIGGDESSIQSSFMSKVKRIKLVGCKDNKKKFRLGIIVKQLHSKDHQEMYRSDIAAKNEEIAYNIIFPNLNMYEISLPVPICFFANDEIAIIEDLCRTHKIFEKKIGFITIKECGYTLKALAKFHAATFVLRYKNNDKLQEIKNLTKNILYHNYNPDLVVLKHQEESLQNILKVHTANQKQSERYAIQVEALEYLIAYAKTDIKDLISKEQDDYVFCHGDLSLTNLLFKINDDAEEKKKEPLAEMDIKLIDFQNLHFCSVASDLVYLFFVNLKPEDYINNKNHLLRTYFNFLKRNVIDCGVGDNFKLTYEWLENEIDRFTEFGIIYALWMLPMFHTRDDDTEDQCNEVTKEMLEESSKNIFYNMRMMQWVDYYSTIYEKKFGK